MELELQAANAKCKELERILEEERHERLALIGRLQEKTDVVSKQQEEIESLKESEGILSSDVIRLEIENDDLRRKEREESAVRERLQQQFDDALERCSLPLDESSYYHPIPTEFPDCQPNRASLPMTRDLSRQAGVPREFAGGGEPGRPGSGTGPPRGGPRPPLPAGSRPGPPLRRRPRARQPRRPLRRVPPRRRAPPRERRAPGGSAAPPRRRRGAGRAP
jgi:hypothetical protein